MGNLLSEPTLNHVLLLGVSKAGKTRFLYEGYLQNKFQGEILNSEGYNVDILKFDNKHFAFWDLGAITDFQQLWVTFFKFIPFKVVVFMCPVMGKNRFQSYALTKKMIFSTLSEPNMQDKPVMLIVNISKDMLGSGNNTISADIYNEEAKECIQWNSVQAKFKDEAYLDVTNINDHEGVLQKLTKLFLQAYPDQ